MAVAERSYSRSAVLGRRNDRRQRLQTELDRIVQILSNRTDIEKVVLFGSLARGASGEHSDLDLVVVQDTDRPFVDRIEELYRDILPEVQVDLLVYTPEEYRQLAADRGFVQRLASEGKTVYAVAG